MDGVGGRRDMGGEGIGVHKRGVEEQEEKTEKEKTEEGDWRGRERKKKKQCCRSLGRCGRETGRTRMESRIVKDFVK